MTNFEKMKNDLCEEIRIMDEKQFYDLISVVSEFDPDNGIDSNKYYSCSICREEHGKCPAGNDENSKNVCYKEFLSYCKNRMCNTK